CSLRLLFLISVSASVPHPVLPSFPTRRSSDLSWPSVFAVSALAVSVFDASVFPVSTLPWPSSSLSGASGEGTSLPLAPESDEEGDRKSTRLNSSHLVISYAVFCLKKKKEKYSV